MSSGSRRRAGARDVGWRRSRCAAMPAARRSRRCRRRRTSPPPAQRDASAGPACCASAPIRTTCRSRTSAGEGFENAHRGRWSPRDLGRRVRVRLVAAAPRLHPQHAAAPASCDVVIGVPAHYELGARRRGPYYRSTLRVRHRRRDRGLARALARRSARCGACASASHDHRRRLREPAAGQALAGAALVDNVRGYQIYGDYSRPNPPRELIDAVARGDDRRRDRVGTARRLFRAQQPVPLSSRRSRRSRRRARLPFAFDIAMGVRRERHGAGATRSTRPIARRRARDRAASCVATACRSSTPGQRAQRDDEPCTSPMLRRRRAARAPSIAGCCRCATPGDRRARGGAAAGADRGRPHARSGRRAPRPARIRTRQIAAAIAEGRQLFVQMNCSGCHGGRAGGGMGPSLRDVDWIYGDTDAQIFDSIAEGRAHGHARVGHAAAGRPDLEARRLHQVAADARRARQAAG